jgi:hypothetical protein
MIVCVSEREVIGQRTMPDELLHKVCSLPNIIRTMKLKRMRWAEHVARRGG